MLLTNYEFHDIHYILILLRAYPNEAYNEHIIRSVIRVLSEPQIDIGVDTNIIRKELRKTDTLENESFRWICTDNVYTYGLTVIHNEFCYSFLEKAFKKLLECSEKEDYTQLCDLADALHNTPILLSENFKNFKKETKIEFAHYNRTYKTNLLKDLSEK
jgi:hypothetical protein